MEANSQIKKVAVVGPECTGKSELSAFLATYYNTIWVKEYARSYIDNLNRPYEETDLLKIAIGQLNLEDNALAKANKVLICDTNLLVVKIWSEYRYGRCHEEILQMMQARAYDLYLLTYIDLPWEDDPQREHPMERESLWDIYKKELETQSTPYVEIAGDRSQRRALAINAINQRLVTETNGKKG